MNNNDSAKARRQYKITVGIATIAPTTLFLTLTLLTPLLGTAISEQQPLQQLYSILFIASLVGLIPGMLLSIFFAYRSRGLRAGEHKSLIPPLVISYLPAVLTTGFYVSMFTYVILYLTFNYSILLQWTLYLSPLIGIAINLIGAKWLLSRI